jgi:hypothetical protein
VLSIVLREGRHLSLAFEIASAIGVVFVAVTAKQKKKQQP